MPGAAKGLHLCAAAVLVACTAGQGLTVHAGSITSSEGNHVVFKGIGWCAVCSADKATEHMASALHKALPSQDVMLILKSARRLAPGSASTRGSPSRAT